MRADGHGDPRMTGVAESNSSSEGGEGSVTIPRRLKLGHLCLLTTATFFALSVAYAFDLAAPVISASSWIAANPRTSALIVFGVMFVGGIALGAAEAVGMGAVGFLVTTAGTYMAVGWYTFFTTGMNSEGVPITAVSPVGAALVLASATALVCCVVGHADGPNRIEKPMLAMAVIVIFSLLFYSALDDYASSQNPVAAPEPAAVHPDHVSNLDPDDCVYEDHGFVRCKIRPAGAR